MVYSVDNANKFCIQYFEMSFIKCYKQLLTNTFSDFCLTLNGIYKITHSG